ncbi:hypothetical protein L7F22_046505, partial [Adiantum nelumboides]|nr:hypothetical protein [Adiantum nelumboides]
MAVYGGAEELERWSTVKLCWFEEEGALNFRGSRFAWRGGRRRSPSSMAKAWNLSAVLVGFLVDLEYGSAKVKWVAVVARLVATAVLFMMVRGSPSKARICGGSRLLNG